MTSQTATQARDNVPQPGISPAFYSPGVWPLTDPSKAPVLVGKPVVWRSVNISSLQIIQQCCMSDENSKKTCPTSDRQPEYSQNQTRTMKEDCRQFVSRLVRCRSSRMLMKWMTHCPPPALPRPSFPPPSQPLSNRCRWAECKTFLWCSVPCCAHETRNSRQCSGPIWGVLLKQHPQCQTGSEYCSAAVGNHEHQVFFLHFCYQIQLNPTSFLGLFTLGATESRPSKENRFLRIRTRETQE